MAARTQRLQLAEPKLGVIAAMRLDVVDASGRHNATFRIVVARAVDAVAVLPNWSGNTSDATVTRSPLRPRSVSLSIRAGLQGDLMISFISRNTPRSLWGQTTLMFIVLAVVLAVLRVFTSQHYFMGAVTVCYGFVIGWFAGWMAKRRQTRA